MRPSCITCLFVSLTAAAADPPTVVQRDLATITSAFDSVGSGITKLDAAIKALSGPNDLANLQSASSALLQAIKSGTTSVQGSAELSLQESVQLQSAVGGLQTAGQSLGSDLASKKPVIEKLGLCKIFQQQTNDIAVASKGLSDAVVGKVPEAARQIAAQLASGFTDTVAQTQATFAEGSCTNGAASGGGAGGASGGGSTPSGTTSSGSSPTRGPSGPGNGTTVVTAAAVAKSAMGGSSVLGLVAALMLM